MYAASLFLLFRRHLHVCKARYCIIPCGSLANSHEISLSPVLMFSKVFTDMTSCYCTDSFQRYQTDGRQRFCKARNACHPYVIGSTVLNIYAIAISYALFSNLRTSFKISWYRKYKAVPPYNSPHQITFQNPFPPSMLCSKCPLPDSVFRTAVMPSSSLQ